MTRKTNDNIGRFGRSFFSKKLGFAEYGADLEDLRTRDYERRTMTIDSKLLKPQIQKDFKVKTDLVAAYQILAHLGLDDHTYTHLSSRPSGADYYYIYLFGLRFEEVTFGNLLQVDLQGRVIEGEEAQYNKTGYVLHGNIYRARPDINTIFHLHSHAMLTVATLEAGLMPLSQWALHFYDRVSYHKYDSLALDDNRQGHDIIKDLKNNYVMLMHNHGAMICGKTIQEAMFYTHHLQQACLVQIMVLSTNQPLIIPPKEICEKAVLDLLNFEENLGNRDWQAWLRKLKLTK